jgi:hypothetical protein
LDFKLERREKYNVLDLIGINQLHLAIKSKEISWLRLMLGETHDVLMAIRGCFQGELMVDK